MRIIPKIIEPLITQAVVDKTIVPEIYLRMSCAVAYHNSGSKEKAIVHMDKAIKLAIADEMYGLLTEYIRHFDGLLEERIALQNENALSRVLDLNDIYRFGWARLSGQVKKKYIAINLTPKEHEVAKLTAFGLTVPEISKKLFVSESTIKQTIVRVIHKTGIQDKNEFSYIL
jgi:DNA-binding NarL/FixJ family response regulator